MEKILVGDHAMREFGAHIGTQLRGGDIVELVGDVGAGKTTLTKGIAQGLGVDDEVQSPSFTISREYETPSGVRLSHYDFYRLEDAGIMANELVDAVGDSQTIVVIEWAAIVQGVLPEARITITIQSAGDDARKLVVQGFDAERNERLLRS